MAFESEQKRLEGVFKVIRKEIDKISDSIDFSKSEILKQNRSMWEDVMGGTGGIDMNRLVAAKSFLDQLAQSNRSLRYKKKRYDMLLRMLQSAYFGRIDFKEAESGILSEIYIGIGTLTDEESGNICIHDWRAPICSIFYDSDIGGTGYMSPEGMVRGELTKRRQYKIEYDRIIHMIDTAIKIDDEILIEILSKNAGSKMRTIVTTIQREQNRIIRDADSDILIAVGPAGSGKTSVAMHRIAYLLYKDRGILNYDDILILTPNNIFSDYISAVLPQLGEENVKETTVTDIIRPLMGDFELQEYSEYMEASFLEADPDRKRNIRTKLSYEFLEEIDAYTSSLWGHFFDFSDISYNGRVIISAEELSGIYSGDTKRFAPQSRMQRIKRIIENKIKKYRLAEYGKQYKNIIDSNGYYSTFEAKKLAKINVDRIFADIDRQISEIGEIDWSGHYLSFINNSYPEVYEITKRQFERKYLLYEEVIPYAYFLGEVGSGLNVNNIRHVIIDELQDHPYINIKYLSKLFGKARFTMLGDQNQSINKDIESFEPEVCTGFFPNRKTSLVKLTKSYRSSVEIYEFCKRILSDDIYRSTAVIRHERKPEIIRLGSDGYNKIITMIENALEEGYKTIAVISKTRSTAVKVYGCVSGASIPVNLIDSEDSLLGGQVNVMPSYFAKGLEFDCVIIPDADKRCYSDKGDRRILYTVCSRALHKLSVCYQDKLSDFIGKHHQSEDIE